MEVATVQWSPAEPRLLGRLLSSSPRPDYKPLTVMRHIMFNKTKGVISFQRWFQLGRLLTPLGEFYRNIRVREVSQKMRHNNLISLPHTHIVKKEATGKIASSRIQILGY